eukprot:10273308-Ditylum_brightwellii.AAC.1
MAHQPVIPHYVIAVGLDTTDAYIHHLDALSSMKAHHDRNGKFYCTVFLQMYFMFPHTCEKQANKCSQLCPGPTSRPPHPGPTY